MKLLHIDSSILGADSASRRLTSLIVAAEQARHPDLDVIRRDLGASPVSHLTGEHLAALQGAVPESPSVREDELGRDERGGIRRGLDEHVLVRQNEKPNF